jgi:glycosyltransferase involved in cell wall biosynthesis
VPVINAIAARRTVRKADAVLALTEEEGLAAAFLKQLNVPGYGNSRICLVAVRLTETLKTMPAAVRRQTARTLRAVNAILVYSSNQRQELSDAFGLEPDRVRTIPPGVDGEFFNATDEMYRDAADSIAPIVSAGVDRGRDYGTLFRALQSSPLHAKLLCRPHNLAGLEIPRNVDVLGYLDIRTYRDVLGQAAAVVLPSRPLAYPTGQTVLLHAMAMGKCCVVTDSVAMREYVTHGHDAILVPPGDPEALGSALASVMADAALRSRIGRAARQTFEGRFTLEAMWASIFEVLRGFA